MRVYKYCNHNPNENWLLDSLLFIPKNIFREFDISHTAHQGVEDTYRLLLAYARKGWLAIPVAPTWTIAPKVFEVYYDQNCNSTTCKKKRREIEENRKVLGDVVFNSSDGKNPNLFGIDDNKSSITAKRTKTV